MIIKDYIDDLQLSEGESYRSDCPMCRGRNTFTATKMNGVILYNCYKLGCDAKGTSSVGYTRHDMQIMLQKESKPEKRLEFVLPDHIIEGDKHYLTAKFKSKWKLNTLKIFYDVKDQRAVFPIYNDSKTAMVDAIGRSLVGEYPKWLRYSGKASYYIPPYPKKDTAVIVEDVISAVAVSQESDADGFAILGTSITNSHVDKLLEYDRVVIALDPDAMSKTIKYTKELRVHHSNVVALSLGDDIKYRKVQDMDNLKEITNEC